LRLLYTCIRACFAPALLLPCSRFTPGLHLPLRQSLSTPLSDILAGGGGAAAAGGAARGAGGGGTAPQLSLPMFPPPLVVAKVCRARVVHLTSSPSI
jgi:hypothetical protein